MAALAPIRVGDIVQADVKGRQFYAVVREKLPRALRVLPLTPTVSYRTVKSTEVLAHWRKNVRRRGDVTLTT